MLLSTGVFRVVPVCTCTPKIQPKQATRLLDGLTDMDKVALDFAGRGLFRCLSMLHPPAFFTPIVLRMVAERVPDPLIQTTPGDDQHPAENKDGMLIAMREADGPCNASSLERDAMALCRRPTPATGRRRMVYSLRLFQDPSVGEIRTRTTPNLISYQTFSPGRRLYCSIIPSLSGFRMI